MYEIKVLSSKDFDSLPVEVTRGSDISKSLGFADKVTGRAYVRNTGIDDLNKYLIDHEFEELTTDKHSHEDENGIRHKTFVPLLGQVVAGFGRGLSHGFSTLGNRGGGLEHTQRGGIDPDYTTGERGVTKPRSYGFPQGTNIDQNRRTGALPPEITSQTNVGDALAYFDPGAGVTEVGSHKYDDVLRMNAAQRKSLVDRGDFRAYRLRNHGYNRRREGVEQYKNFGDPSLLRPFDFFRYGSDEYTDYIKNLAESYGVDFQSAERLGQEALSGGQVGPEGVFSKFETPFTTHATQGSRFANLGNQNTPLSPGLRERLSGFFRGRTPV